jgi:hypothetical protein
MSCPTCDRLLDQHTPSELAACKLEWDKLQEKENFRKRKTLALLVLIAFGAFFLLFVIAALIR